VQEKGKEKEKAPEWLVHDRDIPQDVAPAPQQTETHARLAKQRPL
jgi:hypothetical protein